MALDFRKATDELLATCISHQELADALGVSIATVRQARLGPDAKARRSSPEGWERAVRRLAEDRATRLGRLAKRL
jgi:GMP synthase-like glutamine amidotransferase